MRDTIQDLTVRANITNWVEAAHTGTPVFGWKEEPARKCALPGCTTMTKKGYCCAAHCRHHAQDLKEDRMRIRYGYLGKPFRSVK